MIDEFRNFWWKNIHAPTRPCWRGRDCAQYMWDWHPTQVLSNRPAERCSGSMNFTCTSSSLSELDAIMTPSHQCWSYMHVMYCPGFMVVGCGQSWLAFVEGVWLTYPTEKLERRFWHSTHFQSRVIYWQEAVVFSGSWNCLSVHKPRRLQFSMSINLFLRHIQAMDAFDIGICPIKELLQSKNLIIYRSL